MNNMNYVNMAFIIEKFNRKKIPGTYWEEEELLEWTYEALQQIDSFGNLVYVEEILYVKDGNVRLPVEIQHIEKVLDANKNELEDVSVHGILEDNTMYLINNGHIFTTNEGPLTIIYSTLPVDDNGYPLIPDQDYFISAIIAYLRFQVGERAFYENKLLLPQYRKLEQDWLWCLPQAKHTPKMEILKNPKRFAKIYSRHRF